MVGPQHTLLHHGPSNSSCEARKLLGAGAQPLKLPDFTAYQKA